MPSLHTFVAPRPSPRLQAFTKWLNDRYVLPKLFTVSKIHADPAQLQRLAGLTAAGHAVFIVPNHPRYGTDWMVDKWLFDRAAPGCLSWADPAIVNGTGALLQRFWLKSGLVAAVRTQDGVNAAMDFSVEQALKGVPVLLHPEGAVNWDNERIGDLFPGTAQMALRCASALQAGGASRSAMLLPVAVFHRFFSNDMDQLHADISDLEKRLDLSPSTSQNPATRLEAVFRSVLIRLADKVNLHFNNTGYFHLDVIVFCHQLANQLAQPHPTLAEVMGSKASPQAAVNAFMRAASKRAVAKEPQYRVLEKAMRLYFPDTTPTLTLEQVEARAKRLREDHLKGSLFDTLRRMVPRPVSRMEAVMQIGEPILVQACSGNVAEQAGALTEELQSTLTALNKAAQSEAIRILGAPKHLPNSFCRPF